MADDSDLERTEPASERRLEQAREDGDVPRSRELATCTVLMGGGIGLWMFGESMMRQMSTMLVKGLSLERAMVYDMDLLYAHIIGSVGQLAMTFVPLAALLLIIAICSPMLIGGWLFSVKSIQPNFSRMNPISGLGRLVSSTSLVELGKAIGKTIIVGAVAWIVISNQFNAVMALTTEPLETGSAHLADLMLTGFISITGGLVIIALIDAPYQMWHYANKLKMTREELRQESKESDGNPEIKSKIRQLQREMAKRRMMSEVPTADVVVTNPTHFAVALKYTEGGMRAPVVVAKGADEIAAKIRELAKEHNVPLLEAPPLARALYRHAELGDEIPEKLYTAVAEVLAYVFQLRMYKERGGQAPDAPTELEVPPELDPANPASRPQADNGVLQ